MAEKRLSIKEKQLEDRVRELERELSALKSKLDVFGENPSIQDINDRSWAVLNSIRDAIHIVDRDLRIVMVNRTFGRWCELLELDPAIVGRTVREAFPFLPGRVEQEYERVMKDGTVLITEEKSEINGEEVVTETTKIPLYEDDEITGAITVIRNVTERSILEHQLVFEREQFMSIFDNIDEYIYISDPETYEIVFANRVVKDNFGQGIIGKKCYTTFQGLDAPCDFCTNGMIFGDDRVPVYIWEHHNEKAGMWFRCIDRAIEWPDGRTLRYEMAVDITEKVKAERELKKYSEHLEELVEERTRELRKTREKLVEAEKMALLGRFSGNISHEIRNPLGVIAGAAYYLKKKVDSDDEKVRSKIDAISRQVEICSNIIESVLRLTRMKEPRFSVVDACKTVKRAASEVKPGKVDIRFSMPGDKVFIKADPEQLGIAFGNIITNAVQAMPDGGTLDISIRVNNGDNGQLAEISFADSGPGIPPGVEEDIFRPLFTTKIRGIGLGLSMVKMVVENNGGEIGVESVPGNGAKFSLRFPLIQ